MSEIETWRPVVGYEGVYQVSDQGRVRRILGRKASRPFRVLRPRHTRKGYVRVALHNGHGTRDEQVIHRLVALAFIGPAPEINSEVNHRDADKLNNSLGNLEWCTPQENLEHAMANGLRKGPRGERHPKAKLTWADVSAIRASIETQATLAARYGVSQPVISEIKLGRIWKEEHRPTEASAA